MGMNGGVGGNENHECDEVRRQEGKVVVISNAGD